MQTGWDLDFRQLEAGRLCARATLVAATGMAGRRVEFNRKFHQSGGVIHSCLARPTREIDAG